MEYKNVGNFMKNSLTWIQLHFPFLMHSFIQIILHDYRNATYYNGLCVNAIMNERAHKGFMICCTNIDELTRLYEMLYVHSWIINV